MTTDATKATPRPRKTAIVKAYTVEVSCPQCGETLYAPDNGSIHWLLQQLDERSTQLCGGCGLTVRIPKLPRKVVTQ